MHLIPLTRMLGRLAVRRGTPWRRCQFAPTLWYRLHTTDTNAANFKYVRMRRPTDTLLATGPPNELVPAAACCTSTCRRAYKRTECADSRYAIFEGRCSACAYRVRQELCCATSASGTPTLAIPKSKWCRAAGPGHIRACNCAFK